MIPSPTLPELIAALPEDLDAPGGDDRTPEATAALEAITRALEHRGVPVGRFGRLWTLGTLQGRIGAAYLAWWIRSCFQSAGEKERRLNETNLRAALRLLAGMSYLRGAVMKFGQVIAAYPEVAPQEFVDVLGHLHFEAPPMHYSLVREQLMSELGGDPEALFDGFETRAFAAASLGQVHRARLKGSGRAVAVKVQYPGIARTIRSDVANLKAIVSPMRLGGDWDSLVNCLEDIRRMLELETDYLQEAENMEAARRAFREDDGIVVPAHAPELSGRRVLTMDLIEGVHLDEFLAGNPTQEERDRRGSQICTASFRLSYHPYLLYADPHPGNYIFMPDGRLGVIDFGCCVRYTEADVGYLSRMERAMSGGEAEKRAAMAEAADMTPRHRADEDRFRLLSRWSDWTWEPLRHEGVFDFTDPAYFRSGMDLYTQVLRKRYVRTLPINTWLTRNFFGVRAVLHRLRARVNMREIWLRETTVR